MRTAQLMAPIARTFTAVLAVCLGLVAVPLVVAAFDPALEFYGCVNNKGLLIGPISTSPIACHAKSTPVHWGSEGPAGPPGRDGVDGQDGEDGVDGARIDQLESAMAELDTELAALRTYVEALGNADGAGGPLDCDDGNPATTDIIDGGVCVHIDLMTDPANCSALGSAVPASGTNHANYACVGGQVVITSCQSGRANVDGNISNGCETNLMISRTNCGAVGVSVPPDETNHANYACVGGQVVITNCQSGWADGDHVVANGCEQLIGTGAMRHTSVAAAGLVRLG